jgi:hypothetical protein
MATIINGKIRRIAFNPFSSNPLNPSPTVVFYMEGDAEPYVVGSIVKGLAEAVLLSNAGDEVEATLEKSEHRFAVGLVVTAWSNKTFEREQAALAKGPQQQGAAELPSQATPAQFSVLHSETFRGTRFYFTCDADLERAREVETATALDIGSLEDELDSRGLKWSTQAPAH